MPYRVEEHKVIKVGRGLRRSLVHSHGQSWVSDEIKSSHLAFYQIWSESLSGWRLRSLCEGAVPILDSPHAEKVSSYVQSEPFYSKLVWTRWSLKVPSN